MPRRRWLPDHFDREERALTRQGIGDWPGLAGLDDQALRRLAATGRCSEARLIRLRGQARLLEQLPLAPEEAALLLHAGIADRRGLAAADPQALHRQIGRLQRSLAGSGLPPVPLERVVGWIRQAAGVSGRSAN
ncbi:MAG: DUF4332 domain-containing protein [Cyanobacteriota bacterium]|nr:DUF4332 domain-containing protein [Cyanobacteriota bacterium]